jgi:hypothetical protein
VSATEQLSDRALGRALLARQGLLERLDAPLPQALETIGAMQGQAWSALPVGLWSRMRTFAAEDLYGALARGELHWGIGLRGTLHLVNARQHPAYAVVADEWMPGWQRALKQTTPAMDELRAAMLEFAGSDPRSGDELAEFAERWATEHPGAIDARELDAQRALKWRAIYRWSALTRVPRGGDWGAKTPSEHLAAPTPPGSARAPAPEDALEEVVRRHLRAFGPAAAEDVACWIGARTPPVRQRLQSMAGALRTFADEHGRTLYDMPDAPRPDPDTKAPPRLLGAFDSTLLAYATAHRERILPRALREVVYQKANLQIRPTFLLDGLVAGTWSVEVRRREATLTLSPAARKLARPERAALSAEAAALLDGLYPDAGGRRVVVG